ncbi:MAG TPA: RDD family protein [Actinomycetota bacterium]|nr:RDD family protein [Actinomycetota bacterium]
MAQAPQQPAYQAPGGGGPSGPRAGFWRRFGAALIDGIIIGIVASIISAILGGAERFSATYQGINALLALIYYAYLEGGETGQTLGKKALGIRVIDFGAGGPIGYGRAALRNIGSYLSGIVIGIGYLWMLWDPEKQTWHDKFANSVVVPAEAYPVGPTGA